MAKNMAPMADGRFWIINDHDTVEAVTEEQFDELYKDAGYRKMRENERVPLQMSEIMAEAQDRGVEPGEIMSMAHLRADPIEVKDLKSLRREVEKNAQPSSNDDENVIDADFEVR